MSLQQSKTFFKKLKETCRKIDSDVNELKIKLYEVPDNASELAAKGICDVQDKIKKLKNESESLESKLESRLSHTADFIQHFTDLTADTEISVKNIEKYLKQYGYEPLNRATASPTSAEEKDDSPVKKDCQLETEDLNKTPNIIDYGITSHQYAESVSLFSNRKSSIEDLPLPPQIELKNLLKDKGKSGSTPTLEVDLIQIAEKETPPLPESVSILSQLPRTPKLEL